MWLRLTLLSLLFFGCYRIERYGRGKAQELIVVFGESERTALLLKDTLGEVFYTPHPEPLFTVLPMRPEQFAGYEGYKNVIIVTTTTSPAYKLFERVFSLKKPGIYTVKNAFGEGDFVLGILQESEVGLWTYVNNNIGLIKKVMKKRLYEILRLKAYFAGHDKGMRREVLKKYGFTFDFPKGWAYVVEEKDFVSWAKHYPDRFIFVFRSKGPRSLDPKEILDLRDSLTEIYYDGDRVVRDLIKVERDTFQGFLRLKIYGPWENDSLVMGGPFFTWAFNVGDTFYMIDGGVFAPDRTEKLEFILREEIIASTFQLK